MLLEKATSIYSTEQLFTYALEVSNSNNKALEPLVDSVDYMGVLFLMQQLLKENANSIKAKVQRSFELSSSDALMNRDQFDAFLETMMTCKDEDLVSSIHVSCSQEQLGHRRVSLGELGTKLDLEMETLQQRIG